MRSPIAVANLDIAAAGSTARPNLVMGVNVQVCWEKFCNYWEVEARVVPMDGDRFHLSGETAAARWFVHGLFA